MRSADLVTLLRTALVFPAAYMVLAKYNPVWITALIGIIIVADGFDGYLGLRDASHSELGFFEYVVGSFGAKAAKMKIDKYKKFMKMSAAYGARLDIAGDRVVEYVLWIVYTIVGLVPLFVLFLIVLRHSFVDALMGAKGTSSQMRSRFAAVVYSSAAGRAITPVLKFAAFSYLAFVYSWGYPLVYGQWLIWALVFFIMLRGLSEIDEFLKSG